MTRELQEALYECFMQVRILLHILLWAVPVPGTKHLILVSESLDPVGLDPSLVFCLEASPPKSLDHTTALDTHEYCSCAWGHLSCARDS